MTAKFGAARRRAFLAALRATGNQTLAAERAKVSRSWVHLHRSGDPAFRRAMDEAVAAFARGKGARDAPPSGWGFLDGVELVVRGTGGSGGGKRVQIARARLKEWSPRVENRFLATLAATCNVKAACAAVGLTAASAYNRRRRWPGFERRWDAAIAEGYARIEIGLLGNACSLFSGEGLPDAEPMTGMTVDHAIHLLHMHQYRIDRIGGRPGLRARLPDIEDVRTALLDRVAVLDRAKALDRGTRARDRREWARRRPGAGSR